jgi:serine/threonine-protein kinase
VTGIDPLSRVTAALAGRYAVERELGRGGMATVYLARDRAHDRPVAIKVLRPELNAALGPDRVLREIGLLARLTHPNILPILDSGSTDGLLYYVMPCVAGESLRARLQREGQLPLGDALRIGEQLLEALAQAHAHGVVHRDVKPENILLSHGQALLADFGIALADDSAAERLTATGMSIGTPAYMSPEQAAGSRTVDARSDLYSAACVIYEMLAGEPPFTGPTPQAILARRLSQAVPSLGIVRENLPGGIEPALMRALARAPADRFASAAEFAAALRAGDAGVRGGPERRRAVLVAGGVLVIAAAAFGASRMRGPASSAVAPPAPSADRLRLAVLPFGTLGPDTAAAYLAAGLGEDISAALSSSPDLIVVAGSSSAAVTGDRDPLAAAGRALRVGSVVQGSVQRDGPRLRIAVQLVDVASRATLWSETYDRQADDILAMQQDVAGKVRDALHARLVERGAGPSGPPTRNAAAYDAYLRALYFTDRDEPDSAEAALQLAVARDSGFALAWGELALVRQGLFFSGRPNRSLEQAAYVAAERALALSPDQPQAIVARASLLWTLPNGFQHQRVAQEFRRAIRISPNAVDPHVQLGSVFMHVGLLDAALAQFDTVMALDPVNTFAPRRIGRIRWYQGRYQQALDEWGNDDLFVEERAVVLASLGRRGEALALLGTATRRGRSDVEAVRAAVLASLGRRPEAERAIGLAVRLGDGTSHFHHAAEHIAAAYAQLGDSAAAVAWLQRTAREGMPCYPLFLNDRRLDPVRRYGPFVAFLAEQKRQWEYFSRTL